MIPQHRLEIQNKFNYSIPTSGPALLILTMLVICTYLGIAQSVQINVSPNIEMNENADLRILGQAQQNVFAATFDPAKLNFYKFGSDMKMVSNREVVLHERRTNLHHIALVNNTIEIIYSYRNRSLLCFKVETFDLALNLIDSSTIGFFDKQGYFPNFINLLSPQKHFLTIYYDDISNYRQYFTIDIQKKSLLWTYRWDHSLEKTDARNQTDVLVDDKAIVYPIFSDFHANNEKPPVKFIICKLTPKGQLPASVIDVPFGINEFKWSIDQTSSKLILTGTYWTKEETKAKGIFYSSMTLPEGFIMKYKLNEFRPAIIDALKESKEKTENGIENLSAPSIFHRSDGGLVMILERNRLVERSQPTRAINGSYRSIFDYYYNDMLAVSIDSSGQEAWSTPMFKRQYSQDDEGIYSSYASIKSPLALRLAFNDEIRTNNTVSFYQLLPDGTVSRENILNLNINKLRLMFSQGVQIGQNTCIVPSFNRGRIKLAKFVFH